MLSKCIIHFKLYIFILVICIAGSVPGSLGYRDNAITALTDTQPIGTHEESNDSVTDQRSDHENLNDSDEIDNVTAITEEPFQPGTTENDENPDENSERNENPGPDEDDQRPPLTSEDIDSNNLRDPCSDYFKLSQHKSQQNFSGLKLSADKITKLKLWPEAIIPFLIDEFSYDKVLQDTIIGYLEDASSATGLTFQKLSEPPKDSDKRWVFFTNRRGLLECKDYSTNSFTNTGVQKVILGYDCLNNLGPIAAIVLALAGVPPQHNAPNRDQFIAVSMDSIIPDKRGLFKRLNDADWLFHGLNYDFDSVGHYPSYKYTVDGSATIKKIKQEPSVTADNENFSCRDIQKIKMLYNYPLFERPREGIKLEECKALFRSDSDRDSKLLRRPTANIVGALLSSLEI